MKGNEINFNPKFQLVFLINVCLQVCYDFWGQLKLSTRLICFIYLISSFWKLSGCLFPLTNKNKPIFILYCLIFSYGTSLFFLFRVNIQLAGKRGIFPFARGRKFRVRRDDTFGNHREDKIC
jgi:hypothetical protein